MHVSDLKLPLVSFGKNTLYLSCRFCLCGLLGAHSCSQGASLHDPKQQPAPAVWSWGQVPSVCASPAPRPRAPNEQSYAQPAPFASEFKLEPEEDWCWHQGGQERSGPLSRPFCSGTDTRRTGGALTLSISLCFASRWAPGQVREAGVGWPEDGGLSLEPGPRAVLRDKFLGRKAWGATGLCQRHRGPA